MIAYFDTSALLPLLVEEPGSSLAGEIYDEAERVVSVRLIYTETRAALAQALRMGRLERPAYTEAVTAFDELYALLDVVGVDEQLVRRAGDLAYGQALRGYDAIHLASAERVADAATVLVTGDRRLAAAAANIGIAVANTVTSMPDA